MLTIMPRMAWPPLASSLLLPLLSMDLCLSLLLLQLSMVLPLALPASAALSPLIPYTTLGPGVVDADGTASLLAHWNASYVPRNASYPTVSIGLSLPITSTSIVQGATDLLAMLVDVTNFRGGVSIQGQPHYLSITYTTDGDSPELCAIVYDDLITSSQFAMLVAPAGDALLQAVLPKLANSSATVMSAVNSDPADFATDTANLFSTVDTADARFVAAMQAINSAAQRWVSQGGDGSSWGIGTICLFTAPETLLEAAAQGVRQWIRAENDRRVGLEPISILVDLTWNMSLFNGYLDYASALTSCPDDTDVMLLQGSSTSGLAVAQALAASRLRPKAVIGLNPLTQIDEADPTQLLMAAGWILPQDVQRGPPASIGAMGGVFTSFLDVFSANMYWR